MTNYSEQFGERFQQHALAVLCRQPQFALRFRTAINPKYWNSKVHAIVARALIDHVDEYKAIPGQSLLEENCREICDPASFGHVQGLIEKLYAADIHDAEAVGAKLIGFGKVQAAVLAVIESMDLIEAGEPNKIINRMQAALMVGEDILDVGVNYQEDAEARAIQYADPVVETEDPERIPTGIEHVDRALKGGIRRGELGCVLAQTGVGKTTALINFGFGAMVAGHKVVHYSLEMHQDDIKKRYDDRMMGNLIKLKTTNGAEYGQLMKKRLRSLVRGNVMIKGYLNSAASLQSIRSHLELMRAQKYRPDLILLDYADLLEMSEHSDALRHEIAKTYRALRRAGNDFNAGVWTASQVNGDFDPDRPNMRGFAEAKEKGSIVDIAGALCQNEDEVISQEARLHFLKIRRAEGNVTVHCRIERNRCLLKSFKLMNAAKQRIDCGAIDLPAATGERPKMRAAANPAELRARVGLVKPQQPPRRPNPERKP